jgi:hypothetical protein
MLPRTHILIGAILTFIIYYVYPAIPVLYLVLMFLSSILIDLDHYIVAVNKTKSFGLGNAFDYFESLRLRGLREIKKDIRKKGPFMAFHTIEFHIIVLLLGLFAWRGFLFVFIGMVFHSILDIIHMVYNNEIFRREYWFVNWIARRF